MANSLAYASGYDKNHFRVVALDASSAFCFSRYRMFSERRMGIPARSVTQIGQECPIYLDAESIRHGGSGLINYKIRFCNKSLSIRSNLANLDASSLFDS
jgi:hypothetical protein